MMCPSKTAPDPQKGKIYKTNNDQIKNDELEPNMSIPDSLSLREKSIGNGTLSRLWEGPEPPPMEFIVENFVPSKFITILAGHSGLGKSYIALYLASCICLGIPFFGLKTIKGNVLWLDAELNLDETKRRSFQVARGLGLTSPPEGLYYYSVRDPLGNEGLHRDDTSIISEKSIELTIVDSLSLGASNSDMKEQKDTVQVLKHIEKWGTSICIDHISKGGASGNQSEATIYGSTFKRAIARSTLQLTKADGGANMLRQDKSNFSKDHGCKSYSMDFSENPFTLSFVEVDPSDPRMAGADLHMPASDQTFFALAQLFNETQQPVPLTAIVESRELAVKTIRNHLAALADRITKHGDSTYTPILKPAADHKIGPSLYPDSKRIGIGNDGFIGGETVKTPRGDGVVEEKPSPGSDRIPVRMTRDATVNYFNIDQISKLELPTSFIPNTSTQKTLEL